MKPPVRLDIRGIKCDAVGCAYRDESATLADYPRLLHTPCPWCGAPLLTQDDFEAVVTLLGNVELLNEVFPNVADDADLVRIDLEMDGSGDVRVKE